MKSKVLNILLILTSLIGYLEWSGDSSMFLFQGEMEIISKLFTDPRSVIHPFILLPLSGQLLLLFTVFQKNPNKTLTMTGMSLLALLLLFMFVIGILSLNFRIFISTIPFILTGIYTLNHYRNLRHKHKS